MFKLITHPNNISFIEQFKEEKINNDFTCGVFTHLNGIEVITDIDLPEFTKSRTDFEEVQSDKFVAHTTYKPQYWEIYFGFVKPIMVRNYVIMENMSSYTYNTPRPIRIF